VCTEQRSWTRIACLSTGAFSIEHVPR
jgi:hypothetical protein